MKSCFTRSPRTSGEAPKSMQSAQKWDGSQPGSCRTEIGEHDLHLLITD
jgi:hypothetical protein